MATSLHYRVVLRDAADTADELVVSSHPADEHPYLTAPPVIDGARADLVAGTVDVGSATVTLWDEEVGAAPTLYASDDFEYAGFAAFDAVWTESRVSQLSGPPYFQTGGGGLATHGGGGMMGGGNDNFVTSPIVGGYSLRGRLFSGLPASTYVIVRAWVAVQFGSGSEGTGEWGIGASATLAGTLVDYGVDMNVVSGAYQQIAIRALTSATGELYVFGGITRTGRWTSYGGSVWQRQCTIDDVTISTDSDGAGRVWTKQLYALADDTARLSQLSRAMRIDESRDDGATWTTVHRGYLSHLAVDGGVWSLTIDDARRVEREAELFGELPTLDPASLPDPLDMPPPRVGSLIGGPIADPSGHGPFARVDDFGPTRWHVDEEHDDQGPAGDTRVLRLKFESGYLRPWFDTVRDKYLDDERAALYDSARPYFFGDRFTFRSPDGATVEYYGYFPDLVARLVPVAGGTTYEAMPIARPVSFFIVGPVERRDKPQGQYDALVGPDSTLYLSWGDTPWPGVGTQFDVVLYSSRIDERNPVLLAGHPVDLVAYAAAVVGVPVDDATRVAVRAAIGDGLWYEGQHTRTTFADFAEQMGACGFLLRMDHATGLRQFVATRVRPVAPQFAIADADRVTDDDAGAAPPVIWEVADDSVVNSVEFTVKEMRPFVYQTDTGDLPLTWLVTTDKTITGHRGDTSVRGTRTVTFTLPGMLSKRAADGGMEWLTLAPLASDSFARQAGEVLVDYAGWGVPYTDVLVDAASAAADAQLGDEGTIDTADLPVPDPEASPITARGQGPRVVRVVQRAPQPGAVRFRLAHAGELSQDAVDLLPDGSDAGVAPPITPTLSLAPDATYPATVAAVTITNGAALATDGVRTDLEYRVQATAPAPSDAGTGFGPETLYAGGDATEVDTPALPAGATVWVRARTTNPSTGGTSAWTAWASVTLGGVYEDVLADFGSGYTVVLADFGAGNDIVQADF